MKKLCLVAVFILLLGVFTYPVSSDYQKVQRVFYHVSQSTKGVDWYYKARSDGKQPVPTAESALLEKYGGYWLGAEDEKAIYITFDMGYEAGFTPQILNALKKHNAPAAFFMVEHYIKTNPELILRMISEGHIVGNHSTRHKNMAKLTDFEAFKKELTDIETTYKQLTSLDMPKYFRPPEGTFSELTLEYARSLGYTTVMWSFAYRDWLADDQPSHEFATNRIYSRTHSGEIAMLHATSKTNAEILDQVLTHWESEGYVFKSLDDFRPRVN